MARRADRLVRAEEAARKSLDAVVSAIWATGRDHQITRLLVLSNLATLLAISAREIADWFRAVSTEADDSVVELNVLGMGTFGVGDLFTTKVYVSGAFQPKRDYPITSLFWGFLDRNAVASQQPAARHEAPPPERS